MRIALVKQRYSLRHGGSERYCVNLARGLTQHGHQVSVIGEKIDAELSEEVDFIPIRVNRLTSSTKNRSFAERSGAVARAGDWDIVYGLGRSFGLDVVRVTERLQSHWVEVHYRHRLSRWLQRYNPRHRTLIALERTIFRSRDVRRIVTQSQLDRKLAVDYYGVDEHKVRTIYNGVDTETFHPGVRREAGEVRAELGLDGSEPLLLFASMDFEGKGLQTIFGTLKSIRERDCRLLVLGSGPIHRFRRLARQAGLGNRVIFAGRRDQVQRYYGAADLFLLPTTYEPFPNVNLEALACGLPVVTTETAGGADVIAHDRNGYLMPDSHAVSHLAEILDYHLSLPTKRRKAMSEACWNTARSMTVEENVRQTLELFDEVLLEKFRV